MAENFYGSTHTGRMRDNNEDTYLAETLPNGWVVASVIDGVGGYEGGEVAAEIARKTLLNAVREKMTQPLQTLKESLLKANTAIYREKIGSEGKQQMACVLTACLADVENNQFYYAHVGDTRLYLLRDESLVKVTKDHSFVGFLEDSGRLSEKEAMHHPKRNEINKALGFDPQIDQQADYIETGSSPFLPGDILLLCSDGLSDLVDKKEITSLLLSGHSLQANCEALINAANKAGGKDNITVVLVSNPKKPLRPKATKPVMVKKNSPQSPPPVRPAPQEAPPAIVPQTNRVNGLVWGLAVLCLVLGTLAWWFWSHSKSVFESAALDVTDVVTYRKTAEEQQLSDSISLASTALQLTDTLFKAPVVIGDTLLIQQDTLRINGNGLVLQSDSAYSGPALLVRANNRYLFIENITFADFKTAIVLEGKSLQLRNVQFVNCTVPVQHQLLLPADGRISGTLLDTFIRITDSLPK